MLVPENNDDGVNEVPKKRRPTYLLPRPGATFDMAYFLKNTGPPPPREQGRERRVVSKKKSLTIFKKKKDVAASLGISTSRHMPLDSFVPPGRVEQKVTLKGISSYIIY
jgi:hypothetical protein